MAHYVAGVLDREAMAAILEDLGAATDLHPGDRVRTLRGSMRGTILKVLADGRVEWRTDSGAELIALPESLLREKGA